MKKLQLLTKTLLAVTLLCVGQNASGQTLYSWEGGTPSATETGGTAVASDDESVNYSNTANEVAYKTIRLNGKADFSTKYVTITLSENTLQSGDIIKVTAYRNNSSASKTSGFKAKFNVGDGTVASSSGTAFNNIYSSGTPNTCTFEVPASAAGSSTITMTRSHTDTNLFITKIQIVRTLAGTLAHTASNYCTTDKNAFTNTVDNATEKYHNEGSNTNQGYAFAEYTYSIPAGYLIKSATLSWSATNLNTNSARTSKIYYLNAGKSIDYANMPTTTSLRFNNEKTWIKDVATAAGVSAISDATDVTNAVKAMQTQGSIIFQWTGIAGGANLNGKGAAAASQPKLLIELESISEYIAEHKGDLTGLINGDFSTDAAGWTGGSRITGLARGWSSSSVENPFYERSTTGALSYTLSNMPAGTYKVVAAARGYDGGQITPEIAGTTGTALSTVGDARSAKSGSEINLNGVEMPYSDLGGFTTNEYGHNWKWITATGTLAAAGNLVINFNCVGNSWMPIDDVHLYCTSLGGASYTTTVTEGSAVSNSDGKVVTCDIKLTNPNSIITSNEAITAASGEALNNNLVGSNISNLVLYDGADNTFSMTAGDYTIGAAKYYRSFAKDVYSTVCLPFTPNIAAGTYYEPTTLGDGYLSISEVADKDLKPNTPYILKPSDNHTNLVNNDNAENDEKNNLKYTNERPETEVVDGVMWFIGRLEKVNVMGSWSGNYYFLGTDSQLHKLDKESNENSVAVNPFRAYFYVGGSLARATIRLTLDDVTGISEAKAEAAAQKEGKFVKDGKFFIFKNGKKFNAAGAQLY